MKKLFILALIAIATGTSAFAGPSSKVSNHFATLFSQAENVNWKSTDDFDKVSFVLNNEKVEAFYNKDEELIGTSKTMAFDKLPKAALETITTKYTYPSYQLTDCIEFNDATSGTNYYVSMQKAKENIVLKITPSGIVSVFSKTRK
jgi:bisphosphoglycerate-independent phosphoglycerate mutase (AlkP superfamily)